jgi:hypothetical protein
MPLTKLNSASVIERLPTGSVIQTISVEDSTAGDQFTTNDYVQVMSASITPQYSNSEIYISYQVGIGGQTYQPMSSRIKRDSTVVGSNTLTGGTARYGNSSGEGGGNFSNADDITMLHGQFLDSPTTTSAITYKIEVSPRNDAGNKSFTFGEPHNQVTSGFIMKVNNIITLMEIKR